MATSEVLDAIAATDLAVIGLAPSTAMSMTYLIMADSIGLVMQNAAAQQQRMQMIGMATMAKVLEEIVIQGAAG